MCIVMIARIEHFLTDSDYTVSYSKQTSLPKANVLASAVHILKLERYRED